MNIEQIDNKIKELQEKKQKLLDANQSLQMNARSKTSIPFDSDKSEDNNPKCICGHKRFEHLNTIRFCRHCDCLEFKPKGDEK